MMTLPTNPEDMKVFSFLPSYEGTQGLVVEIRLYVFNDQGALIDSQPEWKGRVSIALTEEELKKARILIAPPADRLLTQPITLESIGSCDVFEPRWTFEPGKRVYSLSAVPETVWRWWLVHNMWAKLKRPHDILSSLGG